jgi:hypothetical protein
MVKYRFYLDEKFLHFELVGGKEERASFQKLASYPLVSPENGEAMMKDVLAKMMVPAQGARKN